MLARTLVASPDAPAPVLTYAVQVNPDPLVALPDVGPNEPQPAPQFASVVLMITNNTSNGVNIEQITFLIPSAAGDPGVASLTSQVPALAQISDSYDYSVSTPTVSTSSPGNVECVITCNTGTPLAANGGTIYVQVYDIEVDSYAGILDFGVQEVLSGGSINNPSVGTLSVQKLPSGFYFDYLVVTAGDPAVPVAQVPYNTPVTLVWSSSIAQLATNTSFIVYYSSADGQQSAPLNAQISTWTSPALTSDTVFTVVAVVDQADLSTAQYALSASVSVQNPDLVAGSVATTPSTWTPWPPPGWTGTWTPPPVGLHVGSGQAVRFELGTDTALSMGAPGQLQVDAVGVVGGRFIVTDTIPARVGINNPNPAYTLDVQGTINATGLSIPGSVSLLGSPVSLQLPLGFPFSSTNSYMVDTDGLVLAVVSGDYLGGEQWGALSVTYTAADGTSITMTASAQNTTNTGTVMDSSLSTLTVPIPNGTTFNLQFWGGSYAAPNCQAWFIPFGAGTATLQPS